MRWVCTDAELAKQVAVQGSPVTGVPGQCSMLGARVHMCVSQAGNLRSYLLIGVPGWIGVGLSEWVWVESC